MSPSRSDRKIWRRIITCAVLALSISASLVRAGDEVDYSAPYLVVENGELVTKYPAREHEAGDSAPVAAEDGEAVVDDDGQSRKTWIIVAVALVVVIAFLAHARRRSKGDRADDPE